MLDKFITPIIKPLLEPLVVLFYKGGITADQLTVTGFLIGMLALPLIAFELWYAALIAIILNRNKGFANNKVVQDFIEDSKKLNFNIINKAIKDVEDFFNKEN